MKNCFKKIWDKIKKYSNIRYLIGEIALIIILFRGIRPSLFYFDNFSLILFIIAVVVLLFPNLWDLLARIKKLKVGDQFEAEFSEILNKMQAGTRFTDQKRITTKSKNIEIVKKKDFMDRINNNRSDVTACLKISIEEIEAELKIMADIIGNQEKPEKTDVQGLTAFLTRKEILPEKNMFYHYMLSTRSLCNFYIKQNCQEVNFREFIFRGYL